MENQRGTVYLVGAGPGDPKLITLRGLECIEAADVVVYDRLIAPSLLAKAKPGAELIYVGKAAGAHAMEQDEINQLLVDKAQRGKVVTRLKGGDPLVFGRGGEEAAVLRTAGVRFEIVPGVTSAIAAPTYAGIPVTHRGVASSFMVITGHEDPLKPESALNWEALAHGSDTLVFLMGVSNLRAIADQLMAHGRSAETLVALVSHGTLRTQQTVTATLGTIAKQAEAVRPPAVLVVGEVVRLRSELRWFDNRPMFGKTVLVTRARHQAGTLTRMLAELGAEPIELPTIEFLPPTNMEAFDRVLKKVRSYQWIVFTSANGVNAFFERLEHRPRDHFSLGAARIAAIGPATAEALRRRSYQPDYVPVKYLAEAIGKGLAERGIAGERLLLARAEQVPERLAETLRAAGALVDEVAVYRTALPNTIEREALQRLLKGEIDVVTFTSSSTVQNLVALLDNDKAGISKATIACIGPVTAETARKLGLHVDLVATEHTASGLVKALVEHFGKE